MTNSNQANTLSKMDVATLAGWRSAGISKAQLTTLIRRGQLVKMRHGVYATRTILAETETDPSRRHALEVAAVTTARSRKGVASHHSAALVHGLALLTKPPEGTVTLTVPPGTRTGRHNPGNVVRHAADLPNEHQATRFAVQVTTAARTVADLARTGTFMEGVVVADSALHQRLASKTEMRRAMEHCAHWPGIGQARKAVDFANPLAESVLESCARVIFQQHGLPQPVLQVNISGREFIGRADFCWTRRMTIAEADGLLPNTKAGPRRSPNSSETGCFGKRVTRSCTSPGVNCSPTRRASWHASGRPSHAPVADRCPPSRPSPQAGRASLGAIVMDKTVKTGRKT